MKSMFLCNIFPRLQGLKGYQLVVIIVSFRSGEVNDVILARFAKTAIFVKIAAKQGSVLFQSLAILTRFCQNWHICQNRQIWQNCPHDKD